MSKHFVVITTPAGVQQTVEVGYDPRLREFFVNIQQGEDLIYTSLSEISEKDARWLAKTLAIRGLALPADLSGRLEIESIFGGSNQVVRHPEFTMTNDHARIFAAGFVQIYAHELGEHVPTFWVWHLDGSESFEYVNVATDEFVLEFPQKALIDPGLRDSVIAAQQGTEQSTLELFEKVLAHFETSMPEILDKGFDVDNIQTLLGFTPVALRHQ